MLPRLKIIVYTDCQSMFNRNPVTPVDSLSDLKAFATHKIKNVVDVSFCFVNRHPSDEKGIEIHARQKVTGELLKDADEFWVFGRRKINNPKQPENELDDTEVAALGKWMSETRKGGVFITGDHAEPDETLPKESSCETANHKTFLSLGRALGHRIPRANQMRDWKGPPTYCDSSLPLESRDNFNTNEGSAPCALDDPTLESDEIPQTLLLTPVDCELHRLFWYTDPNGKAGFINKLPDHRHEGIVLAPDELNSEWPAHSLPPEIVALGRDKRFPHKVGGVLSAFDGYSVGVGRIVADSSFHHYLNYNLKSISARDPASGLPLPRTDLDQIAEFYGNLALWLAPKTVRDTIRRHVLLSLAREPNVLETRGQPEPTVGKVARVVLRETIGEGRLRWLFAPSRFEAKDDDDEFYSLLFFDDERSPEFSFGGRDYFLGLTIRAIQLYLSSHNIADVTRFDGSPEIVDTVRQGAMSLLNRDESDRQALMQDWFASLT